MGGILESRIKDYANFIIRYRWAVLALTVLLVGLAAAGMRHLEFSTNYRAFFSDENPELTAFEDFQE